MKAKRQKYWILFTTTYCPVCGKDVVGRERVYDKPKPKDGYERHIAVPELCDSCFMGEM